MAALTDNKFQIRVFAPGEIGPALQALDAVPEQRRRDVPHCLVLLRRQVTFGFDAGVPFGPTARQQTAWMYHGGGLELMREFMADTTAC